MNGAAESKQHLSRGGQIHAAGFGQALLEQLKPKLQHQPSSAWRQAVGPSSRLHRDSITAEREAGAMP